jgi:putative membrane protein
LLILTLVHFNNVLLTVLGFVVGLALSLRSTTAYERYMEGRRYWASLTLTTQNMARLIWIHAKEREGEEGKQDLLAKMYVNLGPGRFGYSHVISSTCLNLLVAFSLAMKHRCRFQPYADYDDMKHYVDNLSTFAKVANEGVSLEEPKDSLWHKFSEFLGMPWAEKNPRRVIKNAKKPVGNLPLEILSHISGYLDSVIDNGTLKTPIMHVQSCKFSNRKRLSRDV